MIHTWDITLPELTNSEPRRLYLYLPESYDQDANRHYPVLYMFDGHNVFFDSDATYGKSWGLKEYMDYTNTQLIIAAVECNHDPDNGRLREYSPYTFTDSRLGRIIGKGRLTMEWLVHSLKPEIDSRFRTLPDREHTFIAGSSMGGLMSLYAVLQYNHIFSRAAALSPSLWTNPREIESLIHKADIGRNTMVYLDYGSEEMDFHTTMQRILKRTADLLTERQVYVTSRIVPGGTHCEACWEKQLPFMMHTLMYDP